MTTKQKAKRYDEAISQLKGLLDGIHEEKCDIIEEDIVRIFPELAESEDEEIKKSLINYINAHGNGGDFTKEEYITWLEKQSEQKPAWSYEDEANLNNIIWLCNNCINGSETTWIPSQATKIKHLMETIKERGLPQPKPDWSEEDEKMFNDAIGAVWAADYYIYEDKQEIENWLKSIKQRIGRE